MKGGWNAWTGRTSFKLEVTYSDQDWTSQSVSWDSPEAQKVDSAQTDLTHADYDENLIQEVAFKVTWKLETKEEKTKDEETAVKDSLRAKFGVQSSTDDANKNMVEAGGLTSDKFKVVEPDYMSGDQDKYVFLPGKDKPDSKEISTSDTWRIYVEKIEIQYY